MSSKPNGAQLPPKRFRIVALDSGGVYGLFSMLMLRELCRDPRAVDFLLERGCVDLFAGTGAGGVNALILAKHDDPRDGIAEAIEFWREEKLYRNNPLLNILENMQGWMSIMNSSSTPQQKYEQALRFWNDKRTLLDPFSVWQNAMGMGSWYGAPEVMSVLQRHFKGLRLSDLKQKVVITAFNWSGDDDLTTNERHWKPKVYCNFPDSEKDCDSMVADVAFTSLSWMYTLPIFNGEQGGGWFAPDPTLCAVAKVVNFVAEKLKPINLEEKWHACVNGKLTIPEPADDQERRKAAAELRQRVNSFFTDFIADAEDEAYRYLLNALEGAADDEKGVGERVREERRKLLAEAFPYFNFLREMAGDPGEVDTRVLRHLSVLSVGNGVRVPFLPVETAEWGYQQWDQGIFNSTLNQWVRPNQYSSFQAPEKMAQEQCRWLLNDPLVEAEEEHYHRLGPSLFETSVLGTNVNLRNNPAYLQALVREMENGSSQEEVRRQYEQTLSWMSNQGWFDKRSWATYFDPKAPCPAGAPEAAVNNAPGHGAADGDGGEQG